MKKILEKNYPNTTPIEYLNIVNSYFATTGSRLVEKNFIKNLNKTLHTSDIKTNQSFPNTKFKLNAIGSNDVNVVLKMLNNNSAPGPDGFTAHFLKQIGHNVILPIVHIINCSLTSGSMPVEFKVARIVPVYKKWNIKEFSNYRPISLVGLLAKILEKIVKNQLLEFLEHNKIIFEGQYGFRRNLGTEDALFDLTNFLYNKRESKNKILISFLDLEKAFDSISRRILMQKFYE